MSKPGSRAKFDEQASVVLPLKDHGPARQHDSLWREALRLWLQWNEAHDLCTTAMFAARNDEQQLHALVDQLDEIDQLRWRALELSQSLLETRKVG